MLFAPARTALLAAARQAPRLATAAGVRLNHTQDAAHQAGKQLLSLNEIDKLLDHIPGGSPNLQQPQKDEHASGPLTPKEEAELLRPRDMSESYTAFTLPLASDPNLFDLYVNATGGFRIGMLLEHLDSLAGAVAYRHCLPRGYQNAGETAGSAFHRAANRAGFYIATASADRLDMFGRLNHSNVRDLRFAGFVTYTGKSSMEVFVKLEGTRPDEPDKPETLMLGRFAMVCRDAKTNKARRVPPLLVETPEEHELWIAGEEHKAHRTAFQQNALDRKPEAAELHEFMLAVANKDEYKGEKVVPMKSTELTTVQLLFPQQRNLHRKVFGGILMRMAFELAFTDAALFAGESMHFLSLDQITFRLPVPIGAVLRLTSKILATTQPEAPTGEAKVHIRVRAEVEDVETGVRRETNSFYFTMAKNTTAPLGRVVVPTTYKESMEWLEGQRRLDVGDEMRRLYMSGSLAASAAAQ